MILVPMLLAVTILLPSDGTTIECQAFVATADRAKVLEFKCGVPFDRPQHSTVAWIERKDLISFQVPLREGDMRLPLVPATTVVPRPADDNVATIEVLRIPEEGEGAFSRAASPGGVLVPAGNVLALFYDKNRNVLGVSRAAPSPAGKTVPIDSSPPEDSHFLAHVRGDHDLTAADMTVETQDATVLRPSVVVPVHGGVIGIWYDIQARNAKFFAADTTSWIPPADIVLRPRTTSEFSGTLKPLPAIHVDLIATEAAAELLRQGKGILTRPGSDLVVREVALNGSSVVFPAVSPGDYRVSIQLRDWTVLRPVEVAEQDAHVSVTLAPMRISGRITRAGDPVEGAKVTLRSAANAPSARTDNSGRYELMVWQSGRYQVEITLGDEAAAPHIELLRVTAEHVLDWDFSASALQIRVTDAATDGSIGGASVSVSTRRTAGERVSIRDVKTQSDGTVAFSSLMPGVIELVARADGYASSKPLTVTISEHAAASQTITLKLEQETRDGTASVRLPGGAPAAGAEVVGVAGDRSTLLWRERADEGGHVSIPRFRGFVGVRHSGGGSIIRPWSSQSTTEMWEMPPPKTLVADVKAASGESVRRGVVFLWMDGHRMSGEALSFLTFSQPLIDVRGQWLGRNLPMSPTKILVVSPGAEPAAKVGSYDSFAVPVRGAVTTLTMRIAE